MFRKGLVSQVKKFELYLRMRIKIKILLDVSSLIIFEF